jgi:acyl carrier protein
MAFPRQEIENAIRDEIRCASDDRPVPRAQWEPEVDSHVMVRIVLRIEEEIGLELPDDCMPPGGVESIEQCVETITAACERIWLEQRETQGAKVS